jgi:hypothetical protein
MRLAYVLSTAICFVPVEGIIILGRTLMAKELKLYESLVRHLASRWIPQMLRLAPPYSFFTCRLQLSFRG